MMIGENIHTDETWKRIPSNSIGVEIGVWRGDSSEKFLRNAAHLHLVDSWTVETYTDSTEYNSFDEYIQKYSKLVKSTNVEDFQKYYDKVYQSVVKRFENKSITIHRMSSADFFESFTGPCDWIYVDGDHSYEGCLYDLQQSYKLLKNKGGIIFGDDYTNKPGVRKAVDEFIKSTGLTLNNFYQNQYEIVIKEENYANE